MLIVYSNCRYCSKTMAKKKSNSLYLERLSENAFNGDEIAESNESTLPLETAMTPISNAVSLSMLKKCTKIANFLNQHIDNLDSYLQHLRGFALSNGGLINDDYRKKIWPVLARNLPLAEIYVKSSHHASSINRDSECQDEESEDNCRQMDAAGISNMSDSDFESALSNISSSALAGDDEEPMIEEEEEEPTSTISSPIDVPLERLQTHPEWRQVELDVARTLARFPPNIDEERRCILQEQLTKLIVRILYDNPDFNYYQGFHDVALTFLLVLDDREALQAVENICLHGSFRNYLSCSLEESVLRELDDLYVLLFLYDHEVERYLRDVELGTLFALSWPLTWFSHALQNYSQVVLFFDFFLCSHYLMPVYVSVALICERREEVLHCEHEMPMLHKLLNEVPSELNCHRILCTARLLFEKYPPALLKELKKEYVQICERQRRHRSALENLEHTQMRIVREQLLRRRSSASFRRNVYDVVRPFAVCGGMAALAFAYYYIQKGNMLA